MPDTPEAVKPAGPLPRFRGLWLAAAAVILLSAAALNLGTVRAGLPGGWRAPLLFPSPAEHAAAVPLLMATREKIYGQVSRGGYLAHTGQFTISPEEAGPNFARSYLLQTFWLDEAQTIRAMQNIKPGRLQFNPHFYLYGALHLYTIGAAVKLGQFAGLYPDPGDVGAFVGNPDYSGRLWTMPRLMYILALLLGIAAVFRLAGEAMGGGWGLLGAFLMAGSPVLMMETHYLKPYLISMLLSALMFGLIFKRKYRLAAAAAGLSAAFLPTSALMAGVVCAAVFFGGGKRDWKGALACAGISALAFAVCDPWWVICPREALAGLASGTDGAAALGANPMSPLEWAKVWALDLSPQLGLYLALPAAAGAALWAFDRDALTGCCLLSLLLLTPLLVPLRNVHYLVPVMPALVFLALKAWRRLWSASPAVFALLLAAASAQMLLQTAFYRGMLANIDASQRRAGLWLNANLPAGAFVGSNFIINPVSMYPPFRMMDKKFIYRRKDVDSWLAELAAERPQYYLSVCGGDITGRTEFSGLYEKEAELEYDRPLKGLFANRLAPKLDCSLSVYRLAAGAAPRGGARRRARGAL